VKTELRNTLFDGVKTVELRMEGEGDQAKISSIEGYAAVFHKPDDRGTEYRILDDLVERVDAKAFTRSLSENPDLIADFNHNKEVLLGRTSAKTAFVSIDSIGLRYSIPFDENHRDHQDVALKIRRGDVLGSSFGFRDNNGSRWTEERIDGKYVTIRTLVDVDLTSFGPVHTPAYGSTGASVRSAISSESELVEMRSLVAAKRKLIKPMDWGVRLKLDAESRSRDRDKIDNPA